MPNQNGCALTSKDLSVLEDQLTHVAMSCRVAQHHRQHYDALFAFLNGCQ